MGKTKVNQTDFHSLSIPQINTKVGIKSMFTSFVRLHFFIEKMNVVSSLSLNLFWQWFTFTLSPKINAFSLRLSYFADQKSEIFLAESNVNERPRPVIDSRAAQVPLGEREKSMKWGSFKSVSLAFHRGSFIYIQKRLREPLFSLQPDLISQFVQISV